MEEGEQRVLRLFADAQVVEAALARGKPVGLERLSGGTLQHLAGAAKKERRVAVLVLRMSQVEPAEQGIFGELGGAYEVAASRGFRLGEAEQLLAPPVGIEPDPPMQRPKQPVEQRRSDPHTHKVTTSPP